MNKINPVIRFFSKVKFTQFCWEWESNKQKLGYGLFKLEKSNVLAHRFSYELFKGKIPEGLTIDHLCRNRGCVNPGHLECVTHKENVLRGEGPTAINAKKKKCNKGHSLEGDNLITYPSGKRWCRICKRDSAREWARKKYGFYEVKK